jgi:glycosyltransferase involved in cell wall biosynthesis
MTIFIDASRVHPNGGAMLQLEYLVQFRDEVLDADTKLVVFAGDFVVDRLKEKTSSCIFIVTRGKYKFWIWFQFYIWRKKPDVVLNFGPNIYLFPKIVSVMHNQLPFEVNMYERYNLYDMFRLTIQFLITYITFIFSRKIIVFSKNSSHTLERLLIGRSKIEIIPHGVEIKFPNVSLKECSKEKYRFVYVSPILEYKNHEYVIYSFERLRSLGYSNFSVRFVGEMVPFSKKIIDLIMLIDPNGYFYEYVKPNGREFVLNEINNSCFAIYASSCESFGITLVELMLMKIPILANDYATTREILRDGGLYFSLKEADSMFVLIKSLLDEKLDMTCYTEKSYRYARAYTPRAMASSVFNLLNRCLNG